MLKADLLRQFVIERDPFLNANPDRLEVFVTEGNVIATGTAGTSFMYQYKLNLLAIDYPKSLDDLVLPILLWVKEHQPDLIFNADKRGSGIKFDADILDDNTADILFVIQATERVLVTYEGETEIITHLKEPEFPQRH